MDKKSNTVAKEKELRLRALRHQNRQESNMRKLMTDVLITEKPREEVVANFIFSAPPADLDLYKQMGREIMNHPEPFDEDISRPLVNARIKGKSPVEQLLKFTNKLAREDVSAGCMSAQTMLTQYRRKVIMHALTNDGGVSESRDIARQKLAAYTSTYYPTLPEFSVSLEEESAQDDSNHAGELDVASSWDSPRTDVDQSGSGTRPGTEIAPVTGVGSMSMITGSGSVELGDRHTVSLTDISQGKKNLKRGSHGLKTAAEREMRETLAKAREALESSSSHPSHTSAASTSSYSSECEVPPVFLMPTQKATRQDAASATHRLKTAPPDLRSTNKERRTQGTFSTKPSAFEPKWEDYSAMNARWRYIRPQLKQKMKGAAKEEVLICPSRAGGRVLGPITQTPLKGNFHDIAHFEQTQIQRNRRNGVRASSSRKAFKDSFTIPIPGSASAFKNEDTLPSSSNSSQSSRLNRIHGFEKQSHRNFINKGMKMKTGLTEKPSSAVSVTTYKRGDFLPHSEVIKT
mmetsp:Transcript_12822/g.12903  ORF Transcript_12822/g.12903 Transcript_12822/m.12903 type:complete len:518 (-) Transcript_12822:44-1597(-)|eukprot:CAMPEP_0182432366 /NCGR_PEP_ID=MMETSP1167-20130531/55788_1 /TAXON_ID=2988 /ORGANISM="Mallomonas Sp, Strain CCMP3275" /LENGTH=517 /DNA_ID=CAMNT_0024619777 /DNA_START=176 /DNA_END=1729 /DNA_ORIENTATION=-